MTGKVWTSMLLFTTASFIMIYVHHASGCRDHDITTHLYVPLLEDHWFEMKIFPDNKEEHKRLSLMNTLCSNWIKNKDKEEFKNKTDTVVYFFQIMLENLSQINTNDQMTEDKKQKYIVQKCMKYNCTDETTYTIEFINKAEFGSMYLKYCNKPVSDLKCPSKKSITSSTSTICPSVTTSERTTISTPEVSQNDTKQNWTTISTPEVSQNDTKQNWTTSSTPEVSQNDTKQNLEKTSQDYQQNVLVTEHVVLTASLILNILFGMWCLWRRKTPQASTNTEMTDMQTVI